MLTHQIYDEAGDIDCMLFRQLFSQMTDQDLGTVIGIAYAEQRQRFAAARERVPESSARRSSSGGATRSQVVYHVSQPRAASGPGQQRVVSPARSSPVVSSKASSAMATPVSPPALQKAYVAGSGRCYHICRECIHLAKSRSVRSITLPCDDLRACKTCTAPWGHSRIGAV